MCGEVQYTTSSGPGPAGSTCHLHLHSELLKLFLLYKPALFFSLVSFLFFETLPPSFLPTCTASLNPTEGSESGRSTPSLSTFSDGKSPSSTYVPVPRHFHIPGRPARLRPLDHICLNVFILLTGCLYPLDQWTRVPTRPFGSVHLKSNSVQFSLIQIRFGSVGSRSVQLCSDCFSAFSGRGYSHIVVKTMFLNMSGTGPWS